MGMVITCLGISGSGKTVFLGSLLDSLHSPANSKGGFFIADTKAKGGDLLNDTLLHEQIGLAPNLHRIGEDGFTGYPPGTKSTTFRQFSLIQGRESVLDIGWLDYKGGLLTGDKSNKSEQDELYAFLDKSTAIVVYLDAYRIATATSISQARRRVGAEAITNILSHFETSKDGSVVNILIVLTQCDAIEDSAWVGTGDYGPLKNRVKEVLGGFVELVNRNPLWHCGIVSVSAVGIGRNRRKIIDEATFNKPANVSDEIIDEPEPFNIVEAFYWLVGCEVALERKRTQNKIADLKQSRESERRRVESGIEEKRLEVIRKDEDRVAKLGLIRRFLERSILEDDRLQKISKMQSEAAHAYRSSQEGIGQKIDNNIFEETTQLSKFESALQPLFNQSNNAVTRI